MYTTVPTALSSSQRRAACCCAVVKRDDDDATMSLRLGLDDYGGRSYTTRHRENERRTAVPTWEREHTVHKWERRWIKEGHLTVLAWVKTDEKSTPSKGEVVGAPPPPRPLSPSAAAPSVAEPAAPEPMAVDAPADQPPGAAGVKREDGAGAVGSTLLAEEVAPGEQMHTEVEGAPVEPRERGTESATSDGTAS